MPRGETMPHPDPCGCDGCTIARLCDERDALRAQLAMAQKENRDARLFIAALVKGAGGVVEIPDKTLLSLGHRVVITEERDPLTRMVRVRVK